MHLSKIVSPMKQNSCSIYGFLTIFVVLVLRKSTASNPQYEACLQRNISCGQGPNISFPFYIQGRQESYCGSPGFEVTCSSHGSVPTIRREVEYVIEEIFYQNQSVRVYSSGMLDFNSSRSCVPILHNTTTNLSPIFNFVDTENLYLFYNCSSDYSFQPVSLCNNSQMGVVFYENDDEDLIRNATEYCENNFVVPVDTRVLLDNRNRRNIEDVLHVLINGFEMNWVAGNCSVCEQSGGRCGSNDSLSDNRFQCFCPDSTHSRSCNPANDRTTMVLVSAISGGTFILVCLLISIVVWCHRKKSSGNHKKFAMPPLHGLEKDKDMYQVSTFSFKSIKIATNNFSSANKLGEGGFGPVYKGVLVSGQEIAIKRLSSSSGQGLEEFQNEILSIAKLQHNNLVRLLGYCIQEQEMILVYEYMPNKSLDHLLFEPNKCVLLNWPARMNIVEGVAQGLLYLHKHSRLKVIHRDLKASNVLLDKNMSPKISDFGLARIFEANESQGNTNRIVGTHGYMSPEYVINGVVSTKTDVFSFGVLLLEIITGKRSRASYDSERPLNLIGLAWELWVGGRALELMDQTLDNMVDRNEFMRCLTISSLCVQNNPNPSMEDVISMLKNEYLQLPTPKQPAFFMDTDGLSFSENGVNSWKTCTNGLSITSMKSLGTEASATVAI